MLKILIIEDEIAAQELLSRIIINNFKEIELIGIADSISEGLEIINNHSVDLVFFDIELKDGDSFQILDKIQNRNFKVVITTAHDRHAIKAFKYQAIDYILKPYVPTDIIKVINRVLKLNQDESIYSHLEEVISSTAKNKISVAVNDGIEIMELEEIVRLEADGSYCHIYTNTKERIMVSKSLKDFESRLPRKTFFRTHTSHLINLNFVKKYLKNDGGTIVLSDGTHIPLARRRKQLFLGLL